MVHCRPAAPMLCHVLIRRTLDWERAGYNDLINTFVRDVARRWDDTFRLTYTACRARIKAIGHDSLRAVARGRIREVRDFDASCLAADDVLLICDDDDWYHPDLMKHLRRETYPQDRIALWPDGVHGFHAPRRGGPIEVHLERVKERPLDDKQPKTNNYAISGRLLQQERDLLATLLTHASAVRYMAEHAPPVARQSTPLSLVNRHPCSITVLRSVLQAVDPADTGPVLRQLVERYARPRPTALQPAFRWTAGYVDRVRDVFREALGTGHP